MRCWIARRRRCRLTSRRPEVHQDWRPEDIWDSILEIWDSNDTQAAIKAYEEFEAKYLVRGQLLVTGAQAQELTRIAATQQFEDAQHAGPVWGTRAPRLNDITIRVIPDSGLPVDLGGGMQALSGGGRIYVFKMIDLDERIQFPGPLPGQPWVTSLDATTSDGPVL
jgi:hypothetical protein